MVDAATLAGTLRLGVALRDKVVAVRPAAAILQHGAHLETLAHDLALLRHLDLRVMVICGVPSSPAGPDGQAPGLRLLAALTRHREKGVLLPAAGLVSLLPAPEPTSVAHAGQETATSRLLLIDPLVLVQLCALRYVPIVTLPVVDAAGEVVEIAVDELAGAVARFAGAAMLVLVGDQAPASSASTVTCAAGGVAATVATTAAIAATAPTGEVAATPAAAIGPAAVPLQRVARSGRLLDILVTRFVEIEATTTAASTVPTTTAASTVPTTTVASEVLS